MKGKWFAFGCLTSIVVIVAIIFSIFYTLIKMGDSFKTDKKLKIPSGSYLSLALKGEIAEYSEFDDSIFGQDKSFAHEIIHKINRAGTDDNITGIILEPHMISCGYAVMNEIKQALDNFSSRGKPVYAYLETALNKDYLLACSADKIYLNPSSSAGIILTGVGGEILFYKEMFDKIGVEFNVIHAGKYKGAGETFSRDQFTKPVTDNLDLLFEDIYQNLLTTISTDRQLPRESVRAIFETRKEIFINRENALDSGLVDQLIYHDEFIENIGINSDQLINWSKYTMPVFRTSEQQIAVVYLQGDITSAEGNYSISTINYQKLNKIIEDIEKDDQVKGVVLRINSPGGSALESENIYSRLEKLNSKKPIVVSMSNVAASGGYYISAGADYIYADP
ncbi:MAG: S49 family peptidase, partial [Candidatus Cloacimonetes bacterium]|nr:S49 family peptidase [Candidatus Cloacimonadota bacterium]